MKLMSLDRAAYDGHFADRVSLRPWTFGGNTVRIMEVWALGYRLRVAVG